MKRKYNWKNFSHEKWNPQVHKESALRDGKTPEDFKFDQWRVSHVRILNDDKFGFMYYCSIPSSTPQANQFVVDKTKKTGYRALPDPVGIALSGVKFTLVDSNNLDILNTTHREHIEGDVEGFPPRKGGKIWEKLLPGTSLYVYLIALPLFYYLEEDGSARLDYAKGNRGYFAGEEITSEMYRLDMDTNGNVSVRLSK